MTISFSVMLSVRREPKSKHLYKNIPQLFPLGKIALAVRRISLPPKGEIQLTLVL